MHITPIEREDLALGLAQAEEQSPVVGRAVKRDRRGTTLEGNIFVASRAAREDQNDPPCCTMSTAVLIELGEGCARSIGMEPTCFKTHRDSDGLARVPLVPAFFHGPKQMHVAHLMHRPLIQVTFGSPISTAELPFGRGRRLS